MVLNLDLRSEMLKMHNLCRRLQMELVSQITHLAAARPRLKVGVEKVGYSPGVWGCLDGTCQKLVIAFAILLCNSLCLLSCNEVMHTSS